MIHSLIIERFLFFFSIDDDEDNEDYVNFIVIDEFYEKFGSAVSFYKSPELLNTFQDTNICGLYVKTRHQVMHIKKQHVIGVGADGVELFKHDRLCWLQVRSAAFFPLGFFLLSYAPGFSFITRMTKSRK